MIGEKTKKRLNDWARDARALQRKFILNTHVLTPVNYHIQRERFLSSKKYNPQFTYHTPYISNSKRQLYDLAIRLDDIKLPPEIKAYMRIFIHHICLASRVRNAVGTDRFGYLAQKMYNYTISTAEKVQSALPKIKYVDTNGAPLHDALSMRDLLKNYIDKHPHISDASVEVDHFNDYTIRVGHKRLTIGSAVKRNRKNVDRIIIHEIESHMLQRQNIIRSNNPLLQLRTLQNKDLYGEGMAIYNEVESKTMTKKTFELYILRHKAVEMLDRSFKEIFNYLSQYVPENKAFVTTYRVKRGMHDTSKKGGFPKDAAYLLGYKAICDYLRQGGRRELLYISPDPGLGQLLLKYDLLPAYDYKLPRFWKKENKL